MNEKDLICEERLAYLPPALKSIAAASVLKHGTLKNQTCYKQIWHKIGNVPVVFKSHGKMTVTNAKDYNLSLAHKKVYPDFNFTCVPSSKLNHNAKKEMI